MPNLIVERGREKGTTFELKLEAPCVAGRDPTAVQIVISDPAASRRHFQVAAKNGRWFVSDLGSRNHTYVNENKLEREVELASGDRIQVGETVVSFLDEDKGDKSAAQGLNGKEIGGYKILDRLGRGGMGTVFKAKQISLNRVIALKVLASKFAKDPKFVEKFVSEARAAGQLNHPNVVQVFDVGQLGGLHFFSMELMEGGCVQDLLSAAPEGRLSWQEAMPLIVDAARGLVFAEKRGIVHRDIKPDNLMLTSEQRVKIGDLGLAKKAEEGAGDKQIFGTPHFIAPEQAQGKPDVGHPADLYALGATFYRVVTGRTPFTGDTVKEILKKQINDPHQPVKEIVPDFPEDLAAIIDKLMAKKVENRYQSATKLVEDLEGFQLAHQIELSGARKLNKPLMIGLVIVALAAAGVGVYYATRPPQIETKTEKGETVYVTDPEAEKRAEEAKLRLLESDTKDALSQIMIEDARLGPVILAKEAEFRRIADRFDALKTKFSDERVATIVQPGLDRAKAIRTTLDHLKQERATWEKEARDWWEVSKAQLDELEAKKSWSQAIRLAEKWRKDAATAERLVFLKEAQDHLDKLAGRELELAEKDLQRVMQEAEELNKNGEFAKAMQLVREWFEMVERGNQAAPGAGSAKLAEFAGQARSWVEASAQTVTNQLSAALDLDKPAYVDAVRALRSGGAAGTGAIFDFQFDAAATQVESAAALLRTYPYQERAATLVARLRLAQQSWAAWVQLLADGKLYSQGESLGSGIPGVPEGATCTFVVEGRDDDKPTLDHFTIDITRTTKTRKQFRWAELSRDELWRIFVSPKVDKVPGPVAIGLAWAFATLGQPAGAQSMLDRVFADKAELSPEEETALRREITVIIGYEELLKKVGGDLNEVLKTAADWRRTAGPSSAAKAADFYVLMDGRPGTDAQLLILQKEQIDEYVKNLGRKK